VLADRARENISRCRVKLRCKNIEVLTGDVATFEVPTDATAIFFNNPFAGKILASVLDNIHVSYQKRPRRIKLICNLPAESIFGDQISEIQWLQLRHEIPLSEGRKALVFMVGNDTSEALAGQGHPE
jgi:hypothetical protein